MAGSYELARWSPNTFAEMCIPFRRLRLKVERPSGFLANSRNQ
ncbi:hypothetical protein FHX76_001250 [Lysinibacter cavernae]|uniref:Uncharacterized protein n=1 Tax=Lysinibacter cavernae TaxID=1640652 RepID=A0A7X5R0S0_9MICO|nr:hypothetical protein [Lysinibacter cavernae]